MKSEPEQTTTTQDQTYEMIYSETILKSRQSKTSYKSLKLSKTITTTTTTVNRSQNYNAASPKAPRKRLVSFIKCSEEELNNIHVFQIFLKFLKFIDNLLYYVVFILCQLALSLIKVLKFLIKALQPWFMRGFFWLKSQMKKRPIKLRFPFRYMQEHLTLVLDLDETLVHCTKEKPAQTCDFEEIFVEFKGKKTIEKYYLIKRPFLEHFLEGLSKFFTLMVFTSSQQEYADTILNRIDYKRNIKKRFYRQHCNKHPNGYIKDLRVTGMPLDRTIVVDNSKLAFKLNEDNAIHIKAWLGTNENDDELEHLMIILLGLLKENQDIRIALKHLKQENWHQNSNSEATSNYDDENYDLN